MRGDALTRDPYLRELRRLCREEASPWENVLRALPRLGRPDTAEHVREVALKAEEMARVYGEDPEKAKLAGALHDISVFIPNEERARAADFYGIPLFREERVFPMIIHQRLSEEIARRVFRMGDEAVLSAVGCHTTLKANPSRLDMIVFLADKICWDQEGAPPYGPVVAEGLTRSLEEGTFRFVAYLMARKERLKVVHPWLAEAYRWFRDEGFSEN